jgi:hypothetical protein
LSKKGRGQQMLAAAFLFPERMGSLEFSLQAVRFFWKQQAEA